MRRKVNTRYLAYIIMKKEEGTMMNVYPRLKDLREDNEYTQKQIAQYLQTSQQQYARYEKGIQQIPLHRLIKLADLYKCSLDYMVGRAPRSGDLRLMRNKSAETGERPRSGDLKVRIVTYFDLKEEWSQRMRSKNPACFEARRRDKMIFSSVKV
jgi:transcriptional regulator with XRE-family HTH domain